MVTNGLLKYETVDRFLISGVCKNILLFPKLTNSYGILVSWTARIPLATSSTASPLNTHSPTPTYTLSVFICLIPTETISVVGSKSIPFTSG